ncbi:DUF4097 family beta strand repeat-containing protein [Ileibacterium valens]|uniref:DUF4097 family beta strand repeat-containing protein n=1 Tax=Ileibacterium valens TaxID=1862668 RepID=UPI00272B6BDF|nr:DUF4097 family beta strand repeat-containing protein [Ileibacterium valens]
MKKWMITALSCAAIGSLFCAGTALAVSNDPERLLSWPTVTIGINNKTALMSIEHDSMDEDKNSRQEQEAASDSQHFANDKVHDLSDHHNISNIYIDSSIGNVVIEKSNRFEMVTNNGDYSDDNTSLYDFSITNDTLSVDMTAVNLPFGNPSSPELKIYVPFDLNTIEVEVNAGSVILKGFKSNRISASVDMGNILTDNIKAESLNADCNAGDIEIQKSHFKTMSLNNDAGNINFDGTVSDSLNSDLAMGNITIDLHQRIDRENSSINVHSDLGNVSIRPNSVSDLKQKMLPPVPLNIDIQVSLGEIKLSYQD